MNYPESKEIGCGFFYAISPKHTCWWINADTKYHDSVRYDIILGLNRLYYRKYQAYGWQLTLGRFKILYIP
ncbi:MAG: hypothetical protein WC523_04385 [Patescibacteria group bacterium]